MILESIIQSAGLLLGAGLCYQWAGAWRDRMRFPAPGRLLRIPGGALHCFEQGLRTPAIVLEAGISASSVSWRPVQKELARHHRVLAYDRAGYGWSPRIRTPRTIPQLCKELEAMLDASGAPGPYVLVGHSFGGLLLRHFAAYAPEKVAGLVLVDPLEPAEWSPLTETQAFRVRKGVQLSRRGALLARLGVVRLGLDLLTSGTHFLPKLLARVSSGQGAAVPDRLVGEVRKLPPELWPVMKAHWCQPRCFLQLAEYLARLPAACAQALDDAPLRDLPLLVISAGKTSPAVIEAHRATAALSSRGRHILAEDSGHWVQLDRPDLIVQAALDVVEQARQRKASA
ncbi:MAG: alpha/beta hydrolase [Bryobacteraceae bacterium]|nr:alpha/beta hydrolase [Bryobacteraceae bacterium]